MSQYAELPLVYIAAPYSRPDPLQNLHRVIRIASELIDTGLVTPFVPHLTLLWQLVEPRDLAFWYEYDIAILVRCDSVLRLPGMSIGADEEVLVAQRLSLPVFTDTAALCAWASHR